MNKDIRFVSSFITEDPDIFNESMPLGGKSQTGEERIKPLGEPQIFDPETNRLTSRSEEYVDIEPEMEEYSRIIKILADKHDPPLDQIIWNQSQLNMEMVTLAANKIRKGASPEQAASDVVKTIYRQYRQHKSENPGKELTAQDWEQAFLQGQ